MKYLLILTTLTSCILLLFGCNKTEQNYFPLQEGLQWKYKVTKTARAKTEQGKYIFINLPDDKLNNEQVSVRKSMDGNVLYYRKVEDGYVFIGSKNSSGLFARDEQYIFRYPLEKDAQWQGITTTRLLHIVGPTLKLQVDFTTEIPMLASIEAIDDVVKVPAGIYSNCIKIVKHGEKSSDIKDYIGNAAGNTLITVNEVSWYALGVGLVKFMRKETSQNHKISPGDIVIELESFDT